MAEWKRGPSNVPPRAARGAGVEAGLLVAEADHSACGDLLNGAIWHGESAAELIHIIRDGRELDDPAAGRQDGESAAELIQIIRDGRELDDPSEERPDCVESLSKNL
jgi:hypothetical protein